MKGWFSQEEKVSQDVESSSKAESPYRLVSDGFLEHLGLIVTTAWTKPLFHFQKSVIWWDRSSEKLLCIRMKDCKDRSVFQEKKRTCTCQMFLFVLLMQTPSTAIQPLLLSLSLDDEGMAYSGKGSYLSRSQMSSNCSTTGSSSSRGSTGSRGLHQKHSEVNPTKPVHGVFSSTQTWLHVLHKAHSFRRRLLQSHSLCHTCTSAITVHQGVLLYQTIRVTGLSLLSALQRVHFSVGVLL